jgi:hypothetical protein
MKYRHLGSVGNLLIVAVLECCVRDEVLCQDQAVSFMLPQEASKHLHLGNPEKVYTEQPSFYVFLLLTLYAQAPAERSANLSCDRFGADQYE